jgi:MFS family permease
LPNASRRGSGISPTVIVGLAVATQATLSMVQWGLGAFAPELTERFSLSPTELGAVLAAASLGNAVAHVPAGAAVDSFGPRLPLILGGLGSGGLVLLGGLASHAALLAVALFAAGVGAAMVAVAGTVTVFEAVPRNRRGLAMGMRQMAVSFGGLLAAILLPALGSAGGVPLALGVCGAASAATAVGFGLVSGPRARRAGEGVKAALRVSVTPGVPRLIFCGVLLMCPLSALLSFSVVALRDAGAGRAAAGGAFVAITVAAMVARVSWGRLADTLRFGRRGALVAVAVWSAVAGIGTWFVWPLGSAAGIVALPILAVGALGANGVVHLIAGELAGPAAAGRAIGWTSTALFGGFALWAPPLGALADATGYRAMWLAGAVTSIAAIAVARTLPPSLRGARQQTQ